MSERDDADTERLLVRLWAALDTATYRCTDGDREVCDGYSDETVGCAKCSVIEAIAALEAARERVEHAKERSDHE